MLFFQKKCIFIVYAGEIGLFIKIFLYFCTMISTIPYIQSRFDEYNTRFFAGTLPPIRIKLSNARTFLGKVTFTRRRSWLFGPLRNENFVLRINTRFDLPEDLICDTILHEMIHYYIAYNQLRDTSTHGKLFRSEMKRINAEGNRHITISYRFPKPTFLFFSFFSCIYQFFCVILQAKL